ncbi:hypothetical protein J6590_047746 [Homalodisca vitripennis]|nr:hypothetical protein J6590_047746 [Homalodisca vitripennis]
MTEQESPVKQQIISTFLTYDGVKSPDMLTRLRAQVRDSSLSQNLVFTWARGFKGITMIDAQGQSLKITIIVSFKFYGESSFYDFVDYRRIFCGFLRDQRTVNAVYYCRLLRSAKITKEEKSLKDAIIKGVKISLFYTTTPGFEKVITGRNGLKNPWEPSL